MQNRLRVAMAVPVNERLLGLLLGGGVFIVGNVEPSSFNRFARVAVGYRRRGPCRFCEGHLSCGLGAAKHSIKRGKRHQDP